ncbi:leucine-rich repeat domain-containing protein [Candidatus Daviesbacteria bacterium]|nr:leucine-rich repeat domain-containing protein [Candidatus Daviesbacteria bacterium]
MNKKKWLLLVVFILIISVLFYKQIFKAPNTTNQISNQTSAPENIKDQTSVSTDVSTDKKNVLDLSNQGLEKLPAYVLKMSNLEELDISNNRLTGALPAEIHDLRKLRVLDASDNLMTGVPAEVGQLQNLEVLDLSNNKLTGLPNELGNLKKLKKLNLSDNNYSKQDLEVIKKGLSPSVEIIL